MQVTYRHKSEATQWKEVTCITVQTFSGLFLLNSERSRTLTLLTAYYSTGSAVVTNRKPQKISTQSRKPDHWSMVTVASYAKIQQPRRITLKRPYDYTSHRKVK